MSTPPGARLTVGVVGAAGELGQWLVVQTAAHGIAVEMCDLRILALSDFIGITSRLDRISRLGSPDKLTMHQGIQEVISASEIIHWCAPLEALDTLALSPRNEGKCVILHSSLMGESAKAIEKVHRLGLEAAVVHSLVNSERTVIVSGESDHREAVAAHIKSIGLRPIIMHVEEHDRLMARTQAPLAILQPLLPELQDLENKGLLTPSARVLLKALSEVSNRWTPLTVKTLRNNPYLGELIATLSSNIGLQDKVGT